MITRSALDPGEFASSTTMVGGAGGDVVIVQLEKGRAVRADTLKLPQNRYYPAVSLDRWLRDGSLVDRTGTCWYRLARREGAVPPLAAPALLFCDDNLMNTSGLSNRVMPDASILYLRSVGPSTGGYVRVVRG